MSPNKGGGATPHPLKKLIFFSSKYDKYSTRSHNICSGIVNSGSPPILSAHRAKKFRRFNHTLNTTQKGVFNILCLKN